MNSNSVREITQEELAILENKIRELLTTFPASL